MDGFSLKTQSGEVRLPALQAVPLDLVELPVLYEAAACPAENESHIKIHAFLAERAHPVIMTGPRSVIIFSVAEHLLDLAVLQIFSEVDRPDQGSAHDTLVLEGELRL